MQLWPLEDRVAVDRGDAHIVILGFLARKENLRKHMMHAVTLLALIGFAGSARGISTVVDMIRGIEVARPLAGVMQALMALLTLGFVLLAIKSFIDARRQRDVSPESTS